MNPSDNSIHESMMFFDENLRETSPWLQWESNRAHRYAVDFEGKLYPAKKIRSLITGTAVRELQGGDPTNNFLKKLGLKVVEIPRHSQNGELPPLSFKVGHIYDRKSDIHDLFGGSRQSGISPSRVTPAIFLFTGDNGEKFGYADKRDSLGIFSYTGEGQVGDMKITNGNKAITTHQALGKSLHLFKSSRKGGCTYLGEFTHLGYEWRTGPDRTGNNRKIVVFKLAPIESHVELDDDIDQSKKRSPSSLAKLRELALQAVRPAFEIDTKVALRVLYSRSQTVKDYVLTRSGGNCELCGHAAPFIRKDGSPYLEPHHINRLSDGGLDHPKFVAAICPTCHREIHYGKLGAEKNEKLRTIVNKKEEEAAFQSDTDAS